ncbi:hypothetical protein MHBO_003648 [Bonamia ostreae]|uniref:UBA domain-containing protein n=1 Tax=Bonamia ostreae TaxID=126728 RepID=A0ABV2AR40_9EUKA
MASSNLSTNPRMNTAPTGATINNPTNEEIDWEKRYESELDQLKNMGFTDKERNIALLKQTNGNVSVVIDRLLQG